MTLWFVINLFSNLIKLIEVDAKLKEELEKFEIFLKGMRFWKYSSLLKKNCIILIIL
jgi:hypothetical protein